MGVFAVSSKLHAHETGPLAKMRALVLLGGSVRSGKLSDSIGRPVFDLPHYRNQTILDSWCQEAISLTALSRGEKLAVRAMVDRAAPATARSNRNVDPAIHVQIERDPFDYRGTGGVLRDMAADYADDDLLVVANAAQIMLASLARVVEDLAATGGDVALVSHLDGTASGLFLIRCAALREIAPTGFVDMKEQALPAIAKRFSVKVVHYEEPTGLPVRSLTDYIEALRRTHRGIAGRTTPASPFAEDLDPSFGIAEEGAIIDPTVRLHDSVVLDGGRVEADAVLVHSIVCPGAVVRRGRTIIDDFATAADWRRK